jgi:hypothetical protein
MKINMKIIIPKIFSGLYQVHLDNKNYRINNVIRILTLRKDLNEFLKILERQSLFEETTKNFEQKTIKLWQINFQTASELLDSYFQKIKKSLYFNELTKNERDNFLQIAYDTIIYSYLDGKANEKMADYSLFGNTVYYNHKTNYPNISSMVYDKKSFYEIFNDAFYKDITNIKNRYGKHPTEITISSIREIPPTLKIKPSESKVCQIIFDDTTEKQELIDYIQKEWPDIVLKLKSLRPNREKERITTSSNFLRDIAIYNKYLEFKKEGYKNPDIKTWNWLKRESEFKIEIEPNTITKIVSLLNSEIKNANTEK